jgi:hypothetical protein
MSNKNELLSEPWKFRIYRENKSIKMAVIMGGAAMYEKVVDITEQQLSGFIEDKSKAILFAEEIIQND